MITTPFRCSFEVYLNGTGLWGDPELTAADPSGSVQDEWVSLFQRKADSHLFKRLIFDTPKLRQESKMMYGYNPHLTFRQYDDDNERPINLNALFGPPPRAVAQDTSNPSMVRSVDTLKTTLDRMVQYVQFLNRIHNDVMEHPTNTHQMFQKSVFYEVLFYYCLYRTNHDFLTTLILGCNDVYHGFDMASVNKMREKYTGKQYMAIVPRGLGKTRCIKLSVAVALVTFKNCEILTMAHTRSLIGTTKDDVETCLINCFPQHIHGYHLKHHEDCLIVEFNAGYSNRLKYPSACRPASLRGNNPDIGFLDEALCVTEDSYTVINAMIQRMHTKIGFVSSPISSRKDMLLNIVVNMTSKCRLINLYRLCFFCLHPVHVQYSSAYTGCYRKMFAPRYITYDQDNKAFESVITRTESSYENELGVIRPDDIANGLMDTYDVDNRPAFSKEFVHHVCSPTTHLRLGDLPVEEEVSYWIYIDPAYHPSKRSAIALCCVRFVKDQLVVCFLDRKLLSQGDLGHVSVIMEEMYAKCVATMVENTVGRCNFFVAIERNSNPDAVRSYYTNWVDQRNRPDAAAIGLTGANCEFFAFVDVFSDRNLMYGYLLTGKKFHICSSVINFLNTKHKTHFRMATTSEYGAFSKDVCSLEYLLHEIKNYQYRDRKYTGKLTVGLTDDVILCLIMSTFFGMSHRMTAGVRIRNIKTENITNCTRPWIGMNCKCPLR